MNNNSYIKRELDVNPDFIYLGSLDFKLIKELEESNSFANYFFFLIFCTLSVVNKMIRIRN